MCTERQESEIIYAWKFWEKRNKIAHFVDGIVTSRKPQYSRVSKKQTNKQTTNPKLTPPHSELIKKFGTWYQDKYVKV